jgi:hypothetical protein
LAQDEAAEAPAFDAAAEVAAVSVVPEPAEYKRLWTTKHRVRLLSGLAISRDATRVLALLPDSSPVVYEGNSGQEVARLTKPEGVVVCTALSPNGSHGAVGLQSGEVILFDAASGKIVQRYSTSTTEIRAMHFPLGGQHLIWLDSAGQLVHAKIGEAQPQVTETPLRSSTTPIYAFNPGGDRLFSSGSGRQGTMLTKPLDDPQATLSVQNAEWPVAHVAAAVADRYLAYYNFDGRLVVEAFRPKDRPDAVGRTTSPFSNLTAATENPKVVAVSTDGQWIVGVGRGQVEIRHIDCPIYASLHNADFSMATQVAVSPDTLRIAVVDGDGYLSVQALPASPDLPAWRFTRLLKQLVLEKRYEDLDKLAEAMQEDPEPFPFEAAAPKYHILLQNVLHNWNPLEPDIDDRKVLKEWLAARPDSTLAQIKQAQNLIEEGWAARGTGFASTVTPEGFEKFHLRLLEASNLLEPLLEKERPAPEAIAQMLIVAKAESRSRRERQGYIDQLMEISPRFNFAHEMMVESLLQRWGGRPGDIAQYAAQVADKIGGDDGDVLYARLVIGVIFYEGELAAEPFTGLDFDRAIRGAEHMQKSPALRPLGTLYELRLADVCAHKDRVARVIATIDKEKLPYVPGAMPVRYYYEHLYRTYLGVAEAK